MQKFDNLLSDKKKKTGKVEIVYDPREQDNSFFRCLGSWKAGPY